MTAAASFTPEEPSRILKDRPRVALGSLQDADPVRGSLKIHQDAFEDLWKLLWTSTAMEEERLLCWKDLWESLEHLFGIVWVLVEPVLSGGSIQTLGGSLLHARNLKDPHHRDLLKDLRQVDDSSCVQLLIEPVLNGGSIQTLGGSLLHARNLQDPHHQPSIKDLANSRQPMHLEISRWF